MSTNDHQRHFGRIQADDVDSTFVKTSRLVVGESGSQVGDAWQSYTPTITNTGGALGAGAAVLGRYQLVGKTCTVYFRFGQTAGGTAGSGSHLISLPPSLTPAMAFAPGAIGAATLNVGGTLSVGVVELNGAASNVILRVGNNGAGPSIWGSGFGPLDTATLSASATFTFETI
jgi:hypothetical protein